MDQPAYIVGLLRKHLDGTLNEKETLALQAWANASRGNQRLLDQLAQDDQIIADIQLYWDLWNNMEETDREKRILNRVDLRTRPQVATSFRRLRQRISYAAAVIVLFAVAFYFIYNHQKKTSAPKPLVAQDILPGGNRATLTLEDGKTIDLNSRHAGIIIGNDITYLDGSTILNTAPSDTHHAEMSETLVLKTPIGGNYQVVLPDGTQVWLNANSTLKYPSQFSSTERVVQLEGEAYFQVKHQRSAGKDIPFKVMSNGQTVHVLGTEFNISAYAEEPHTKTTLVNGSIEIVNLASNRTNRITPGQQATLQGTQMKVSEVDVAKSIAWKNSRFSFDGKSFEQIMREMARWYNLTIEYKGGIPTDQFMGDAYKTDRLGTVLRFLESSDIQYRVEPGLHSTNKLIIDNTGRKEAIAN